MRFLRNSGHETNTRAVQYFLWVSIWWLFSIKEICQNNKESQIPEFVSFNTVWWLTKYYIIYKKKIKNIILYIKYFYEDATTSALDLAERTADTQFWKIIILLAYYIENYADRLLLRYLNRIQYFLQLMIQIL